MLSGQRDSAQQGFLRLAALDPSRFSPGFYPAQEPAAHTGACLFRLGTTPEPSGAGL